MIKDFHQFLNEGVHSEFRKLTNQKIVDTVDQTLKNFGIDLHFCKFKDNGHYENINPTYNHDGLFNPKNEVSMLVNTDNPKNWDEFTTVVYLFINIGEVRGYTINKDGEIAVIDKNNIHDFIKNTRVFTIDSYGHDSRNQAIKRDKKNLNKESEPEIFHKDSNIVLVPIDKKINTVINKLNSLDQETLISKLSEILSSRKVYSITIRDLENYQKKLYKLCSVIEDCKQTLITFRNGLE